MFVIIPIGHDRLTLRGLPFATFGIVFVCLVAFVFTFARSFGEEERIQEKSQAAVDAYRAETYTVLPDYLVAAMDAGSQKLYRLRRAWIAELAESPDTAIDPSIEEALASPTGPMMENQGRAAEESIANATRMGAKVDSRVEQIAKTVFLVRYRELPPGAAEAGQARVDARVADLETARDDTVAHRFGYVPARPGIGLVTSVFLHAGIIHFLGNMIFLWIAAVKLEQLWSKPVFIACFLGFGVVSALAHGLTTSEPEVPLVGASGAIAGMMGAMLLWLPKDKIHFVYIFAITLHPVYGKFEAPAYLMLPLWLVTQLIAFAVGSADGTAYAAHIGGFGVGALVAFILKKSGFAKSALEEFAASEPDPEDHPLVAFRAPEAPPAAATAPAIAREKAEISIAALVGVERTALRFETVNGEAFSFETVKVVAWCFGKLVHIDPRAAAALGPQAPKPSAVLLAFAAAPSIAGAPPRIAVVDAAKLKYSRFSSRPAATPKDAFFRLTAQLNAVLSAALFVGDRETVQKMALPEIGAWGDLVSRLENAAAARRPTM